MVHVVNFEYKYVHVQFEYKCMHLYKYEKILGAIHKTVDFHLKMQARDILFSITAVNLLKPQTPYLYDKGSSQIILL